MAQSKARPPNERERPRPNELIDNRWRTMEEQKALAKEMINTAHEMIDRAKDMRRSSRRRGLP